MHPSPLPAGRGGRKRTGDVADSRAELVEHLTVHSLTWLVVANAVGLWMATLLLAPRLGVATGAASYGRWLPLHLDFQFYGWISLPLVGLLFVVFLPADPGRLPRLAVGAWSAALAFSGVSWLTGHSSGKIFLEWAGAARAAWGLALGFLAVVVIHGFRRQDRARRRSGAPLSAAERWIRRSKIASLVAMLPIPLLLVLATSPRVYPPINPDTGGATATNTLGSVLGVVAILLAAPLLLRLKPRDGGRAARWCGALLALHFAVFALLDHGDRSHRNLDQFLGLASLLAWWPLGRWHLAAFDFPRPARPWLRALGGWSALLLASGIAATTPGILERWKFTNVMVGHVHLAIAGLCTCLCILILVGLGRDTAIADLFARRFALWAWNLGLLLHVGALTAIGSLEAGGSQILWSADPRVAALYALRWISGTFMLAASVVWLRDAVRVAARLPAPARHSLPVVHQPGALPDVAVFDPHLLPAGR